VVRGRNLGDNDEPNRRCHQVVRPRTSTYIVSNYNRWNYIFIDGLAVATGCTIALAVTVVPSENVNVIGTM